MDYMIELVRPVYSKLGWEPKPDDSWTDGLTLNQSRYFFDYHKTKTINLFSISLIRPFILRFACEVELIDCVNRAKEHFIEWKNENTLEK